MTDKLTLLLSSFFRYLTQAPTATTVGFWLWLAAKYDCEGLVRPCTKIFFNNDGSEFTMEVAASLRAVQAPWTATHVSFANAALSNMVVAAKAKDHWW